MKHLIVILMTVLMSISTSALASTTTSIESKNNLTGFHPQKGDVVVIENGKHSIWGHIAIYTGNCWISDFKQKTMSPYRKPVPYNIFRHV